MMRLELRETPSGHMAAWWAGVCLDDPVDPVAAAKQFLAPGTLTGDYVVIFGGGLGYRVREVLALTTRCVVYEPCPGMPSVDGVETVRTPAELSLHLQKNTVAGKMFQMVGAPAYRECFPQEHAAVVDTLNEVDSLRRIRQNTIRDRMGAIIDAFVGNLPHLAGKRWHSALGRPLEGVPAFIVSAGPSLDKNVHLLSEAAERGALIVCSTAAPAVLEHAPIDCLVCIEALRSGPELAGSIARSIVYACDASAHPDNLREADIVFASGSDPFRQVLPELGGRSLPFGPSVATAAFELAKSWGADPIVMVGQDCAYSLDGRTYASGVGRDDLTVQYADGVFTFAYTQEFIARFCEGNVPAPPPRRPAIEVSAWGGGTIPTTHDMALFARWFEAAAPSTEARLINATEGGVRLAGFEELPLQAVLSDLDNTALSENVGLAVGLLRALGCPRIDPDEIAAYRRTLLRQCNEAAKQAQRCLTSRQPKRAAAALQAARAASHTVTMRALPAITRAVESGSKDPRDIARAIRTAAGRVRNITLRGDAVHRAKG